MATEPTILVKKADGSFVRMPLSEVKKLKSAGAQQTPANVPAPKTATAPQPSASIAAKPMNKPTPPPPPKLAPNAKPGEFSKMRVPFSTNANSGAVKPAVAPTKPIAQNVVASTTPTNNMPTSADGQMRKAKTTTAVKPDDFSDPFEDLPAGVDQGASSAASNRGDEVEMVLKKLSFPIAETIKARINSAVTLFLKDIRTAEQTKDLALKPVTAGGLGLTPTQTEELLRACETATGPSDKTKTVQTNFKQAPAMNLTPNMPKVVPPSKPALTPLATPNLNTSFAMNGAAQAKPMMRDVVAPQQVEVGPVDEIRLFSLTDFRRLSQNPAEAAARLAQKFSNLKAESVLLYFQGLAAWRESPLFKDYLSVVTEALNQRTKLSPVATSKPNGIQIPEIDAIVKMEKSFSI